MFIFGVMRRRFVLPFEINCLVVVWNGRSYLSLWKIGDRYSVGRGKKRDADGLQKAIVKTFELTDVPVRAGRFVARKNWIVCGSDGIKCPIGFEIEGC
jgi:hypothetical protein